MITQEPQNMSKSSSHRRENLGFKFRRVSARYFILVGLIVKSTVGGGVRPQQWQPECEYGSLGVGRIRARAAGPIWSLARVPMCCSLTGSAL